MFGWLKISCVSQAASVSTFLNDKSKKELGCDGWSNETYVRTWCGGEDVIVRKIDFEFFAYGDISDYSVATARIKEAINPNPTSKSASRVRSRGGATLELQDAKPLTGFPHASTLAPPPAPGPSSVLSATSKDMWGFHQSMTATFSAERDRALESEREIAAKAIVAERTLSAAALATEREHTAKAVEQARLLGAAQGQALAAQAQTQGLQMMMVMMQQNLDRQHSITDEQRHRDFQNSLIHSSNFNSLATIPSLHTPMMTLLTNPMNSRSFHTGTPIDLQSMLQTRSVPDNLLTSEILNLLDVTTYPTYCQ